LKHFFNRKEDIWRNIFELGFNQCLLKELKEWSSVKTQVRIGSGSTNERLLRKLSLCSRQISWDIQGDVNFKNSNFM